MPSHEDIFEYFDAKLAFLLCAEKIEKIKLFVLTFY